MSVVVKIEGRLSWAEFVSRTNRFTVLAENGKDKFQCHLPNPGRLEDLLHPGAKLLIKEVSNRENRKTNFDVIGIMAEGQVITVDSRLPNRLMKEGFRSRKIPEFADHKCVATEPRFGASRLDFLLSGRTPCLVEVKSCTLVRDGVALFPDAPTERGRRHLKELQKAHQEGYKACVIFVIQRVDAEMFSPNWEIDPQFSSALQEACHQGVDVYAYFTRCRDRYVELVGSVPVKIERPESE